MTSLFIACSAQCGSGINRWSMDTKAKIQNVQQARSSAAHLRKMTHSKHYGVCRDVQSPASCPRLPSFPPLLEFKAKKYPDQVGKSAAMLPTGWFKKVDDYGRSFYVDSTSGKSYWRKPIEVQGGLVIRSEEERREFFKGIYSEVVRRYRQVHGTTRALPTFIELYKVANNTQVSENDFGTFLRGYISSIDGQEIEKSIKASLHSPSGRQAYKRRAMNNSLAIKASEEAALYARRKQEQREKAREKKFGHAWERSGSQHTPFKTPNKLFPKNVGSINNARKTSSFPGGSRQKSPSSSFRRQNKPNSPRPETRGVHQPIENVISKMSPSSSMSTPRNNPNQFILHQAGTIESSGERHKGTAGVPSCHPVRSHPTLLNVVLSRTEEDREKSMALRDVISGILSEKNAPSGEVSYRASREYAKTAVKLLERPETMPGYQVDGRGDEPIDVTIISQSHVSPFANIDTDSSAVRNRIKSTNSALARLEAAENACKSSNVSVANGERLDAARSIISKKFDEEVLCLLRALGMQLPQTPSGTSSKNTAPDTSSSMHTDIELNTLKCSNDLLKERLAFTQSNLEILRDSESSLKRELLAARANMARLEADTAGEVAAHAALANQLRELRSTSDAMLASRNVSIREISEKNIILQSLVKDLQEELEHCRQNGSVVNEAGRSVGKGYYERKLAEMEDEKRYLLATLQAREAEIEANKDGRKRLTKAIDSEALAKQRLVALKAENEQLLSRLEGAFEKLTSMEDTRTTTLQAYDFQNSNSYDIAIGQMRDLERKLQTALQNNQHLHDQYSQMSRDNEVLAQKLLNLETLNLDLERERNETAERLKRAAHDGLKTSFVEQIEADAVRKINAFSQKLHQESQEAHKMATGRVIDQHQKELERHRADAELAHHSVKSQLLSEVQKERQEYEAKLEAVHEALRQRDKNHKASLDSEREKAIKQIEAAHEKHEHFLVDALAQKQIEMDERVDQITVEKDTLIANLTKNLEEMFQKRILDTEVRSQTSEMRARRGVAAKMLVLLFSQAARYRQHQCLHVWKSFARVMSAELSERASWNFCQNTAAANHLKYILLRSQAKQMIRAFRIWKQKAVYDARQQSQLEIFSRNASVGIAIQILVDHFKLYQKAAINKAFFRWKWIFAEEDFQGKIRVLNERARGRAEVQGLQFKQLYTENSALRKQVSNLGRQIEDLTTKAELWRRRCISN